MTGVKYQIVVPMAGQGQRFVDAGYAHPKPLIKVGGVTMVNRVMGMFPAAAESPVVFVVNQRHADQTNIREYLTDNWNRSQVVVMPEHKEGPVKTVMAAADLIEDDAPVFVAYCDGEIRFDLEEFASHVDANKLDGCLFTHTGFHPHVLSATKMAYLRVRQDGLVAEVKEKANFTETPGNEHASSGVYWFRSGRVLKEHFSNTLASPEAAYNGEHYVTLAYNSLIASGLRVGYYSTSYVAILGTPEEVQNYEAWLTLVGNVHLRTPDDAARCFSYWREHV